MAMLLVNGVAMKSPTSLTWGLTDVSDSDAGRTDDALMHKNRIAQKRSLNLTWDVVTQSEAATILQAVNSEYFSVTYPDAMTGSNETKTFYVGDRSAPVYMWTDGQKFYSSISFNFIER